MDKVPYNKNTMKRIELENMKKGDIILWKSHAGFEECRGIVKRIGFGKSRMEMTPIGEWIGRKSNYLWHPDSGFYLINRPGKPIPETFKAKNKKKITCKLLKKY